MIVKCKEKSLIEAACNGHQNVYPEAEIVFTSYGWIWFCKRGKKVFGCDEDYARANFIIINELTNR
ncbi:MAG: hypothetical protein ACFFDN_09225 [Candidatus Hodarchaeota archaeon]